VKRAIILIFVCLAANAHAARFLFDADHGESAGNADWVIDADAYNLTWNSSGTFTVNTGGNESNAQRIPTPLASTITSNTPETYWSGALSAWGVDLVKRGHSVETLPAGTTLTYNTANSQDLTNYDVVIIDEPNILFASTEKQALVNFVQHGGSLFMISDHAVSDRNSDGQDSVSIWNDFLTNNGLTNNPFGITFRTTGTGSNESGNNTFNHSIVGDPILNGPVGLATNVAYFNGNQFQIDNTKNPTVVSRMWFGLSSDSNNFCALASLQYGSGRVVVCGDSSPIEDGTGDPNDSSLFNGYTGDAGGVQHIWILNSSEWLAAPFAVLPTVAVGVTNVTPACGTATGGTAVTITGSNFLSGATVLISGVTASNVVIVSSNMVTAFTPANTVGAKIVSVTNTNGNFGALTNGFTYVTALNFGGLAGVTPATEAATLNWSAGTGAVSYRVFQAITSGAENFNAPVLTTNGLAALIAPLYPGSNSPITYFFVVRAVDGCGNAETNTIEKSVQPLLDPTKSQVGDGIPNGWKQQYGFNPFDNTVAATDSDGDGFSNLQEFLAGTDPTNILSSPFRITDIHVQGSDVSVTWQPGTGVTNALQATAGDGNGGYNTNSFGDIFIVTNTSGSITNYIDSNAATNLPARYYRVRLVP
jgi:IPT/TIG domain